ncbi:MAG: ATP-binding protein [Longimicrobiales bacterium]
MAVETAKKGAFARSDQFHRLVLEAVRDYAIFAVDPEGMIVSWNAGAERLTGYPAAEAIGRTYNELFSPGLSRATREPLDVARDAGRYEAERWWRTRDGRLIWVHEVISVLETHGGDKIGYAVITRDLTERLLLEERQAAGQEWENEALVRERELRMELQIAERRSAFLAEASSILVASSLSFESTIKALARLAVSRLADWCLILELNEAERIVLREIAHRDPREDQTLALLVGSEIEGRGTAPIMKVIKTEQSEIINDVPLTMARLLSGIGFRAEVAIPPVESVLITPLLARGQVLGAIACIASDPVFRYKDDDLALAEELSRRAAMAMDNARLYHEAQEANRAKADFLAIMSHELRTPLNAIMGYADLLDGDISGELTAGQRKHVARVRASARHLLQLIEEILSFARIEQGGEEVHIERIQVDELAREAAAVMEPLALAKGLEFRVVERGDPLEIETDVGKARQILVNLLSNAVKFTDVGRVELAVDRSGDEAVFTIRDTGVGIVADKLDRIFDPFWQAERPNTRRVGGTGLGLSVCRRFARLLSGDISVFTTAGAGATFTVRLPLRLLPPTTARDSARSLAVAQPNL